MFRIDNYIEDWVGRFSLISDEPAEIVMRERFFRIDSITSLSGFLTNLTRVKSPCVAYVTQFDADLIADKKDLVTQSCKLFFLVNEGTVTTPMRESSLRDTESKIFGFELAQHFLNYMVEDLEKRHGNEVKLDLSGGTLFTLPSQFNGWWPTELIFDLIYKRSRCIDHTLYKC